MGTYRYQVRDTQTGATVVRSLESRHTSRSDFWWLEGNMACDCNRALAFDPDGDPPCNTGPNRYVFDWVEIDGVRIVENDAATGHATDQQDKP